MARSLTFARLCHESADLLVISSKRQPRTHALEIDMAAKDDKDSNLTTPGAVQIALELAAALIVARPELVEGTQPQAASKAVAVFLQVQEELKNLHVPE
jgi:hypothetical protein